MSISLVLLCAVGFSSAISLSSEIYRRNDDKCGYESCTQAQPDVLNVHIVPHTHDDVGWLKTVDQYYYGSRNNIQKAGVQYILDSVVKELWQDPKRRFIYVETAFFWKWWVRQSDDTRHKVHVLVRQGRLQFAGGAWSMNDEAAAHYQSIIDQFTWGLRKLNETFGPCGTPRVGWQIDPFGHSREFASLLAAMGYDGLFLGRIDYQDKRTRLVRKNMEMVWRGDDDLGNSSDLFTGVLFNTYSPPAGFCFDVLCDDEPIIDDPDSPMFNVDSRVSAFLVKILQMSLAYTTDNVLITMGDDFQYQDAAMWFTNLDKLILYTNMKAAKDGLNIKLFYSTPDCYLKAVRDANPTLPTKRDDFFPYASDPTAYWTGYFTSRPTTKYFERQGNAYLQMVKNLQVLADLEEHNMFVLNELKSAMGVMQHHDAITGTEKQHVARDYERLLDAAVEDALLVARQAFNKIAQEDALKLPLFSYSRCKLNESSCPVSETSKQFVVTIYNPVGWDVSEPIRIPVTKGTYDVFAPNGEKITSQLVEIPDPVRNIPTRRSQATHEVVFIAKLHPLGVKSFFIKKVNQKVKRDTETERKSDHYHNVDDYWDDVRNKASIDIQNIEESKRENEDSPSEYVTSNNHIPINEYISIINIDNNINNVKDIDLELLRDRGEIPNLRVEELEKIVKDRKFGKTYTGSSLDKKWAYPILNEEEMRMLSDEPRVVERAEDFYIENQHMKLRIDNTTGQVTHMILPNLTLSLRIGFLYWTGRSGNNSNPSQRSSGAYIFRPETTVPYPMTYKNKGTVRGPVVTEVRAESVDTDEKASSVLRVYDGLTYMEHDFVAGPINIADGVGKEYVVRYFTDLLNFGTFYTDSNGRQTLERKLNQRPQWNLTLDEPIAGNYYPVTNKIHIQDNKTRMSVLTDRSEGGSSIEEGLVELMVHRRLLHDDAFGVGEALNETAAGEGLVVRGTHRILNVDPNDPYGLLREKQLTLQTHLRPIVFVSNAEEVAYENWINLNNCFRGIQPLPPGIHLLTLEPWAASKILLRFENYLEKSVNSTVELDLSKVFNFLKIKSIRETTLAVNRWLKDTQKWFWNKESEFSGTDIFRSDSDETADIDDGLKIKIKAKQIRTFIADYEFVKP